MEWYETEQYKEVYEVAHVVESWTTYPKDYLVTMSGPTRVPFLVFPKYFQKKNVNVAVVFQQRCLEESGQWLENPSGTCQWQVSTTKTINTECSNPNFEVFVEFKVILFCF